MSEIAIQYEFEDHLREPSEGRYTADCGARLISSSTSVSALTASAKGGNLGHDWRFSISAAREHLAALREADTFAIALDALDGFAAAIDMPRMTWTPDISEPYFNPDIDAFFTRQRWPAPFIEMWWERNATLKSLYFSRCRFEHLPFVTRVAPKRLRRRDAPDTRLMERAISYAVSLGVNSILTTPVHLPRGQIAMLSWAAHHQPEAVKARLSQIAPELLAAGHHLMRAYLKGAQRHGAAEEALSPLSPREWDCIRLTAQGYRVAEVADLTGISSYTVRFHLDNVASKLGATNRAHAIALAAQLGLLGPIGV